MSDRDEKIVNEFMNTKLNKVCKDMGRTREEVYNRMKQDDAFRIRVNQELTKEIRATTKNEVREAAKRLKEDEVV